MRNKIIVILLILIFLIGSKISYNSCMDYLEQQKVDEEKIFQLEKQEKQKADTLKLAINKSLSLQKERYDIYYNYLSKKDNQKIQKLIERIEYVFSLNDLYKINKQLDKYFNIAEQNKIKEEKIKEEQAMLSAKEKEKLIQEQEQYNLLYKESYNDGLTYYGGINYFNGRMETYYSSNILYHYMTPQWTLDSEGFWRTDEGYYVVAASDMPQGTIFEGSKGYCIVLDTGCDEGITDYYVAW